MAYDPKKDLIKLGGKDYLEVKFRLIWLRDDHPNWGVETELLQLDAVAIVKASIKDETGRTIATGHGMAKTGGSAKWAGREIEKAETAAIGRALAHAGIGTQFIDDETEGEGDHDHIADSPVERKSTKQPTPITRPQQTQSPAKQQTLEGAAPTFDAVTGEAFLAWITAELDMTTTDTYAALSNANGDVALHSMVSWKHGYLEAIAAVLAFKMGYAGDKIAAFIGNVKRTGAGFRNQQGGQFKPAELEQIRKLALELVK